MPSAEARARKLQRTAEGHAGLPTAPQIHGNWQADALCLGRSTLFLSEDREDHEQAQAVCAECPVIDNCRAFASSVKPRPTLGVWAGRVYRTHA